MTTTELALSTTAWLQEGLWLKDIIVRLGGPAIVQSYIEARAACRNLPWQRSGGRIPTEEERRRGEQCDELHQACVAPLVDALNSGQIIAVRPDGSISGFVRLLPPAAGWRFRIFDLNKSLIFDPKSSACSLFVLFMFADREATTLEPATVSLVENIDGQQSAHSTKTWLTSAIRNIPPDDRKHGWKRRYARKLADAMAEEAKTNKNLKPLIWTSISTRLNEHKLWPGGHQHDHDHDIERSR